MMRDTNVVRKWLSSWSMNMLSASHEQGMPVADLVRQCYHYLTWCDKDAEQEDMSSFWWLCVSRTILRILAECQKQDIDCNPPTAITIMDRIHIEEEYS